MAMRLEKPVVPEEADIRQATKAFSLLKNEPTAEHYVLASSTGNKVELSPAAFNLLLNVLQEMSHGNAVLVVPIHAELTTQEAATKMNVSRPYLIKLLEEGKIRFQLKGKHRRILFKDLMEYKQKTAKASYDALSKLAAESEELGLGM
jgi:excisionase family DNA binding protein